MAISIVKKVSFGFGLTLLLLVIVAVLSYRAVRRSLEDAYWVSHTHEVLAEIEGVVSAIKDVQLGQRGYLITANASYLEPYQAGQEDLRRRLARLRELTADNPEQQQQLDRLGSAVAEEIDSAGALVDLQRREGPDAARQRLLTGEDRDRMTEVRAVTRAMADNERVLLSRRVEELTVSVTAANAVRVGSLVLALLLVGWSIRGTVRDTARREEAERELGRQSELLLSVLNGMSEGVVVAEPGGRFSLFNPEAERILGIGATDRPATEWAEVYGLFLPDQQTRFPAEDLPLARALRGETVDDAEMFVRHAGRPKGLWISVSARPLGSGGGLAVFRDVTQRKQAQAALLAANRRLQEEIEERGRLLRQAQTEEQLRRQIVETANDAFVGMDSEGRVADWNRQAERIFGWRRAEALGRNLARTIIPPDRRDAHTEGLAQFVATGEGPILNRRLEVEALHRDGRRFPVEVTVWPSPEGPDVRFNAFIHDISERKAAEESVRRAKEAAEAANRAKSEFLANMSHELRTPLNSVIGFSNILLKNKAGNLRGQDLTYLTRILENGKHLLGLINTVLDLSKIEAGRADLEIAPVALDWLVRKTLQELEGRVIDRDVKLLADLPAVSVTLETDAVKLKQVLINLLGNALKFTARGTVMVSVVVDGGRPLRIDVSDTGIGIPRDKLETVFEAFRQADSGTERKYGGTGLGLTISRSLCRLLGYRLMVASEVGKGSTFSVLLTAEATPPVHPVLPGRDSGTQAPAGPLPPAAMPAPALRDRLVLVIDDEPDSRVLLSQVLQGFGCRVVIARGGEEGLRMARDVRPDLITLDLMMPGTPGSAVLSALRADPQLTGVPVLVVSIVAGEHKGLLARDPGASDGRIGFLDKPLTPENLANALALLLGDDNREGPAR